MIFDEVVLNNFGLYAGLQTVTLTPPSPGKPVVLIGGLNGGGKTTFLDALQLCLFGPHAKISNRGTLSYQEYLSRSIHRKATVSKASVEISFRHTSEGREEHYRLHRSWQRNAKGCIENVEVRKNGVLEPTLADNWPNQVEEFFPANIAHLFLFDGEQAETYAAHNNSSELVGAAIDNLLGLDIVDRLQRDLLVFERRKRSEIKANPRNEEISKAQNAVRDLRNCIDKLSQKRAALQTHRIDRCQRELQKVEDNYHKAGGGLYDRKREIEQKWDEALEAVQEGENFLRDTANGSLPLVITQALLKAVESRDLHEEKCRRAHVLGEELKARDGATLKHLRREIGNHDTYRKLKDFLEVDREKRRVLGSRQTVLNISPEVRSDIHSLLNGAFKDEDAKARKLLKHQAAARAKLAQIQIEKDNIPEPDTIAQFSAQREALKHEISELGKVHSSMGEEIEKQKREVDRLEKILTRLVECETKAEGERQDRSRILRHSVKVRTTLDVFRRSVIERHIRRIEHLVLESYQQLLRKSVLVTRLSIDPTTFSLTLYGRDGNVLSTERLSAGERQLLAIALLWGLAKASGRPLPTAIDTPLGRLDSGHRMHVVERYLPYASHQVLLLSTDEEITGDYLERLNPWIGRTYQLEYDDETGQTQIMPGYFKVPEAA